MSKPIANMPGPGGSMGMCGLCGDPFLTEILLGKQVRIASVEGLDKDICLHDKCADILKSNGNNWRTLPEGPLRKLFQEANDE